MAEWRPLLTRQDTIESFLIPSSTSSRTRIVIELLIFREAINLPKAVAATTCLNLSILDLPMPKCGIACKNLGQLIAEMWFVAVLTIDFFFRDSPSNVARHASPSDAWLWTMEMMKLFRRWRDEFVGASFFSSNGMTPGFLLFRRL